MIYRVLKIRLGGLSLITSDNRDCLTTTRNAKAILHNLMKTYTEIKENLARILKNPCEFSP